MTHEGATLRTRHARAQRGSLSSIRCALRDNRESVAIFEMDSGCMLLHSGALMIRVCLTEFLLITMILVKCVRRCRNCRYDSQKAMIEAECARNIEMAKNQFQQQSGRSACIEHWCGSRRGRSMDSRSQAYVSDVARSSRAWSARLSADELLIFSRLLGSRCLTLRGDGTSMR